MLGDAGMEAAPASTPLLPTQAFSLLLQGSACLGAGLKWGLPGALPAVFVHDLRSILWVWGPAQPLPGVIQWDLP